MPNAQEFIDALRSQDYFKVLEFSDFVAIKYTEINQRNGKDEPIGADELVPLTIYELCQTDINDEDIEHIMFLFSYIAYHKSLNLGIYGYRAINFTYPVAVALAAKKKPEFTQVKDETERMNQQKERSFLQNDSAFSIFLDNLDYRAEIRTISTPLSNEKLYGTFATMAPKALNRFHAKIEHMRQHEGININCPFNETFKFKLVVNYLSGYLQNKLAIQEPKEALGEKGKKLFKRHNIIYTLEAYCRDKTSFNDEDKEEIRQLLKAFQENQPSWFEQTLVEKLSDIFSLGIRPLYMSFFSKEAKFDNYLEHTIDSIAPVA